MVRETHPTLYRLEVCATSELFRLSNGFFMVKGFLHLNPSLDCYECTQS